MKSSKSNPVQTIRAGNISIPIYKTTKGFMAKWTVAGQRKRMDRIELNDLVHEIREVAANLATKSFVDASEGTLLRDIAYYKQLEEQLNGTPLHIAAQAWLMSNKEQSIVPAKVSDLISEYLESIVANGYSSGYQKSLRIYLGKFNKAMGYAYIHDVTTDELYNFLNTIPGIRYRKNIRTSLITFFKWAKEIKKALPEDQPTEADRIQKINVKRNHVVVYTPEVLRLMLSCLSGEIRDVVVLGALCGLRSSEITGEGTDHPPLFKESILFDFDQIRVGEQKVQSKGDRFVPLLPVAKAWLSHLQGQAGPVWTGRRFDYHVKRMCEFTGIEFIRNGFRKSWITYRMAVIKNAHQVATEAGNSPDQIFKHYRRPELTHVAEEWFDSFPPGNLPTK